jgi:DNA-binding IclR family transcriptional regulator
VSDPWRLPPRTAVRSVERALAALDFLVDAAPRAVRVTDVAHHLELSLATASRLLATMGRERIREPDQRTPVYRRAPLGAAGRRVDR